MLWTEVASREGAMAGEDGSTLEGGVLRWLRDGAGVEGRGARGVVLGAEGVRTRPEAPERWLPWEA
nr:hypothetical protein [Sphingosinicella sp. CPCC 101087]